MVCGSIGYGGYNEIKSLSTLLRRAGFDVLDQIGSGGMNYSQMKDFSHDKKLADLIVQHDLGIVKRSDLIVALCDLPSYGTGVEMFFAKKLGKKVILLAKQEIRTPWPVALADHLVKSEDELLELLRKLVE